MAALLGENAKGLSANTISMLKERWMDVHHQWRQCDLIDKRYVYFWVDGIYSNVRLDDRLCLLVEEGYRESEASWLELLNGLVARGLTTCQKLATADGALSFWKAQSMV